MGYEFADVDAIEKQTAHTVVASAGHTMRIPNGVIVLATANTIARLALRRYDNHALVLINDAIEAGVPVIILPSLKLAHTQRKPFSQYAAGLRDRGVTILHGEGGIQPTNASSKDVNQGLFPWFLAVNALWSKLRHPVVQLQGEESARIQ